MNELPPKIKERVDTWVRKIMSPYVPGYQPDDKVMYVHWSNKALIGSIGKIEYLWIGDCGVVMAMVNFDGSKEECKVEWLKKVEN